MEQPKLRSQFPLSPRKFWKKVIEKVFILIVLGAGGGAILSIALAEVSPGSFSVVSATAFGLVGALLITVLYAIYVHFYIKMYFYEDDNDFLTIRKGVFTPAEIHVQYLKIQDVYVDQDILDRIMGLYDVHISSATVSSGLAAHIDGVEKSAADSLKNLFLGKVKRRSGDYNPPSGSETASQLDTQKMGSISVKFSESISSEKHGLSSNWWVGEFVKITWGSVVTPIFIVLYFVFSSETKMSPEAWLRTFYIWLGVLAIYVFFSLGRLYLWKIHYKYEFGEEYIYMKEGVLSVSEKNMGYNTIQDVKIHQSLVDRIFKVADLIIENASPATGQPQVSFFGKKQSESLLNGIKIEGLSRVDAGRIAEELKRIIKNKAGLMKGI